MKVVKISSDGDTGSVKALYALPALILILMFVLTLFDAINERGNYYPPLVLIVIMVVIAIIYKKNVWCLADEVCDEGDGLRIRRGKIDEKVFFNEILFLENKITSTVPRIGIKTAKFYAFGDHILFIPDCTYSEFKNVSDLRENLSFRIHMAKPE